MEKLEHHKVVLLGDSSVGKSSIVSRYVNDRFFEYNESTIGAAFFTKKICKDDRNIVLDIWDTAGQERYNSLLPMYYRHAKAVIIVYDVTSNDSLKKAKFWYQEISHILTDAIIIIAANKLDLLKNSKPTSLENDIDFPKDMSNIHFIQVSAKTNFNIDNLFDIIINNLNKPSYTDSNINHLLYTPSSKTQHKEKNNICKCT